MGEQYIFTMEDLRKFHGKNEVLKGIYLSFYPGAKKSVCWDLTVPENRPCYGSWPDKTKTLWGLRNCPQVSIASMCRRNRCWTLRIQSWTN